VDNHDSDRFLFNHTGDQTQLKNALTWTMLWHGLPIVYYGTEQVQVSNQSDSRTSMWPYYGETSLSLFLKEMNHLRKEHGLSSGGDHATSEAVVVSSDVSNLAFIRGDLIVFVTNKGDGRREAVHNNSQSDTLCVPISDVTSKTTDTRWARVCSTPQSWPETPVSDSPDEASLKLVFGSGATPACKTKGYSLQLCYQQMDAEPVVFALQLAY